jgi:hypothetical protein
MATAVAGNLVSGSFKKTPRHNIVERVVPRRLELNCSAGGFGDQSNGPAILIWGDLSVDSVRRASGRSRKLGDSECRSSRLRRRCSPGAATDRRHARVVEDRADVSFILYFSPILVQAPEDVTREGAVSALQETRDIGPSPCWPQSRD